MKKTGEGLILRGLAGPLRRQAGSHKGSRWLPKHSGHKKAPQVRGCFLQRMDQANTISSPSTLAVIAEPGKNLPARIICASGFSIQRWIARFNGRAPYTGS